VALKQITVAEVLNGISTRIPEGRHIRAMYGALTKPPADGTDLEDIEGITSDKNLSNFIMLAKRVVRNLCCSRFLIILFLLIFLRLRLSYSVIIAS